MTRQTRPPRLIAAMLLCGCGVVQAATFTVTKTSDTLDGACNADCSLREAIQAANASPGLDTVVLKATTYKLTRTGAEEDGNASGDLDVSGDLLLKGASSSTVIDPGLRSRALEILAGATVEVRDLQVRNGYVPDMGGAIANAGTLKLERVRLRFNRAAGNDDIGRGGGIANEGTLTVLDSQLIGNDAGGGEASAGEGGGIYNTGTLIVRGTRFVDNHSHDDNDTGGGGAIMNRGGSTSVGPAFFQGNTTGQHGYGGALANRAGGQLDIINTTISGNVSGEPPNAGGAVANGTDAGDAGRVTVRFSTIADNDGGGLFNAGETIVENSIIAGNYEEFSGGTPDYGAAFNCRDVGSLSGVGIVMGGDACYGTTIVDNATAMSEVLFPLNNNGGFAATHALRYRPITIDAASNEVPCIHVDQRGAMRPADGNNDGVAACDIGAFERNDDD